MEHDFILKLVLHQEMHDLAAEIQQRGFDVRNGEKTPLCFPFTLSIRAVKLTPSHPQEEKEHFGKIHENVISRH